MGGRASLTLHSRHSSSKHSLAPARKPEVCPDARWQPKSRREIRPQSNATPHFSAVTAVSKPSSSGHRRRQIHRARSSSSRLNTHSPAASAANAGGFLQTSLSEVTRRSRFRLRPALTRRVTPDRVIALIAINFIQPDFRPNSGLRVIQQLSGRAHRRPGCTGGQCTRGCLRDRVGLSNGGNIAPTTRRCRQSMAASACRMISRSSFPDRELLD